MSKVETKFNKLKEDLKVNLESLEKDAVEFGLEGVKNLKKVLDEAEKAINEKKDRKKVKTITISEDTHSLVKKFCVDNDEKISDWVETVLIESMNVKEEK